jgi:hypothetical protein
VDFASDRVLALIGFTIAGILGVIAWGVYWSYRKKQLYYEERRAMIEKGMEPPPEPPPAVAGWPGVKAQETQLKFAERRLRIEKGLPVQEEPQPQPLTPEERRRRGIMMLCAGAGIGVAALLLSFVGADGDDAVSWAAGLGPLIAGIGLGHILSSRRTQAGIGTKP